MDYESLTHVTSAWDNEINGNRKNISTHLSGNVFFLNTL